MDYGKDILSLEDVKSALYYKELRQKVSVVESDVQAEDLFIRGCTQKG